MLALRKARRAGPATRRGAGAGAGGRRGAGRGGDGERLRHRPPHPPAGTSGRRAGSPAADAGPRVRRHGGRGRALRPERRGRRLRLRREPHHLRRVLPVPHRPRAHVRAHAHPRRRPRRRVRALRGRPRVGDLAERPRRSCRPRSPRSRSRSATPSSPPASRTSPAARSRCSAAGRSGCSRSGSPRLRRGVGAAADRTPFRLGLAEKMGASGRQRRRDAGHAGWFLEQNEGSAATSCSRCPARRGRSPTRSGSPATAAA